AHATAGSSIGDPEGTVTIVDDDAPPTVSISAPSSVLEGDSGTTAVTVTVTLAAASGRVVTVDMRTQAGGATAGEDFMANDSLITFAPGQISRTFVVAVIGDLLVEGAESFDVTAVNGSNVTVPAGTTKTVTIADD